jgi:co-chaperonin GroES (HSP10)
MLKAVQDKIVVRVDSSAEVSTGGIAIPETARAGMPSGTVLSVGKGVTGKNCKLPVPIEVGDTVFFSTGTPKTEVTQDTGPCIIIRECDVLAVTRANRP